MALLTGAVTPRRHIINRNERLAIYVLDVAAVPAAGGHVVVPAPAGSSVLEVLSATLENASDAAAPTKASGTVLFNDAMTAADTITVNGVVYTFAADPTLSPYNVDIGASAAASAANFRDAINRGAGAGVDYHEDIAPHPDVVATLDTATVTLTARVPGTAGNALTLAASDEVTSNTLSGALLTGGSDGGGGGSVRTFPNSESASTTEDDAGSVFIDHSGATGQVRLVLLVKEG